MAAEISPTLAVYVPTWAGVVYFALIIDVYSRMIVSCGAPTAFGDALAKSQTALYKPELIWPDRPSHHAARQRLA